MVCGCTMKHLLKDDREDLKKWLSEDVAIMPGEALRVLRELHPYGRHLSLTLRDDLTNVRNPTMTLQNFVRGRPRFSTLKSIVPAKPSWTF